MAANEIQIEKYKCDRCGYWFEFSELAYLGSEDESCSPFMKLDAYCHDCYEEDGERNGKGYARKRRKESVV